MIIYKTPQEIAIMRQSNQIVAQVLAELRALVRPGVRTRDLDAYAEARARELGAVPAGPVGLVAQRLIAVVEAAFYKGLEQMKKGNRISDISHAIQEHVESEGFSVIRSFVGHGIGHSPHEEPQVPNFGPPGRGPKIKEGLTLAIEPMIAAGDREEGMREGGGT